MYKIDSLFFSTKNSSSITATTLRWQKSVYMMLTVASYFQLLTTSSSWMGLHLHFGVWVCLCLLTVGKLQKCIFSFWFPWCPSKSLKNLNNKKGRLQEGQAHNFNMHGILWSHHHGWSWRNLEVLVGHDLIVRRTENFACLADMSCLTIWNDVRLAS